MRTSNYSHKKISTFILACILAIYTFRKVQYGIDVTDTGYHFSNFMYMQSMDPMWIFSTYLSSYLGYLITLLPGGSTLLGMNIYTSVIPMLMSVGSYLFCVKCLHIKIWIAFWGNILALSLCWCPTTCIYNYLTYLIFMAAVICLYIGLVQGKLFFLVLAGSCLGLNVFVRFPNVAEIALIIVVWESVFLKKESMKSLLQKTGACVLGFLLGLVVVLIQIACTYGIDAYVEGIIRLLSMSSDASGYTLYEMIYSTLQAYLFSIKWFIYLIVALVAGMLGFMVLPRKFTSVKTVGLTVCFFILFRWFYGQGMFNVSYDGYGAMLNWGVLLLMLAIVFIVVTTLSKKFSYEEKIFSGLMLVVIGITPLGSNNQLYSNLNNMMLVIPFVLYYCHKCLLLTKEYSVSFLKKEITIFTVPLKIAIATVVCMASVQIVVFGAVFVFRDTLEYGDRDTQVTSIDALRGMYTSATKAKALEELGEFVATEGLTGKSVLLYGDIPALSAYLEMPFVLSPWPDLASYTEETFEAELLKLDLETDRVVLLFSDDFNNTLTTLVDNEQNIEDAIVKYGLKAVLIHDMIETYDYEKVFDNGIYVIYE
ncbi:MAG: hypothetical protein R3Y47_02855 [Lachnospiraceae bacterium]